MDGNEQERRDDNPESLELSLCSLPTDVLSLILALVSTEDILCGICMSCKKLNFGPSHDIWVELIARRAQQVAFQQDRTARVDRRRLLLKPDELTWRQWFVHKEYEIKVREFVKFASSLSFHGLVRSASIRKMHQFSFMLANYPIGKHDAIFNPPSLGLNLARARRRQRESSEEEVVDSSVFGAFLTLEALSKGRFEIRAMLERLPEAGQMLLETAANLIQRPRPAEARRRFRRRIATEINAVNLTAFIRENNQIRLWTTDSMIRTLLSVIFGFGALVVLFAPTDRFPAFALPALILTTIAASSQDIPLIVRYHTSFVVFSTVVRAWSSLGLRTTFPVLMSALPAFLFFEDRNYWLAIYFASAVIKAISIWMKAGLILDWLSWLVVAFGTELVMHPLLPNLQRTIKITMISLVTKAIKFIYRGNQLGCYADLCRLTRISPDSSLAWALSWLEFSENSRDMWIDFSLNPDEIPDPRVAMTREQAEQLGLDPAAWVAPIPRSRVLTFSAGFALLAVLSHAIISYIVSALV